MVNVLKRIYEYREKRNWTEYQLAERSGLTQSTISSWYRKNMLPTLPSLEKICAAFGITLSQFFAEEKDAVSLTDLQRNLLSEISHLSEKQQEALLDFIKTL
ncbi:MAG: helix-turn-helix transcriptional regulator [Clostridiales bacterium]|nr:helix-turn-helix transcriptional regulator [Clostridiales bacterium]